MLHTYMYAYIHTTHMHTHTHTHTYIHHFHTLDQRDLPVYISYITLWSGIYVTGFWKAHQLRTKIII